MKKARTRKSKTQRSAVAAIVAELHASPYELAGRLMDNCQTVETQMKLHIHKNDPAQSLDSLEGKTFGQLLAIFRRHSSDQELNDWLERLRLFRNDVAHTFFRDMKLMRRQFGRGVDLLNHKTLRKGLRTSEICHVMLRKLKYSASSAPASPVPK